MSLAIDVDSVSEVLLNDGWHLVIEDSFDLDAYEYLWGVDEVDRALGERPQLLHGGGHSGVCATGCRFIEPNENGNEVMICGPLTAIFAVRYRRRLPPLQVSRRPA